MIKFKKSLALVLALLITLATIAVTPFTSSAVEAVTKYMAVGEIDTSASEMYDNYSKMVTITADSSNPSVATIVINPTAEHSVTVTALSVGQTTINVYANGNVAKCYNIIVTEEKVVGSLSGTFVLVHDKGDIGTFGPDGTYNYTTSTDDYVWVRNYDTGVQYCTDGWTNFADTVTLVNEHNVTKNFDKMYVPAGTHTLTLTDNGNDTYGLTYAKGAVATTTIAPTTNSEPTNPVDDGKIKLQVLGDSIAYGYGLSSTDYGYPRLISNSKGYSLNNNAVNGHASYDLEGLLNSDSTVITNVSKADLVSISIGGNDLLQNMNELLTNVNIYGADCQYVTDLINNLEANLGKIITKIHQLSPNAVILLQTLYNPTEIRPIEGMNFSEAAKVIYPKLNKTYTNVSNNYDKVYVADVYTAFVDEFARTNDTNLIQADGIHPSESGNVVIYNTLIAKINQLEDSGVLSPGEKVDPTTATQTTQSSPGTLKGKFVLVHETGDIGFFESNGTMSYTTAEDDYVWVRNYDTGVQYCTDGWTNFADTVTLVNEHNLTTYFNKMYIPAGTHTLTLIDNGDDTYVLTLKNVDIPTNPTTETETSSTSPTYLIGDANSDGKVNVKDATIIQKRSAGMSVVINPDASDANKDGKIDVRDATAIQKHCAGLITL